MTIYWKVIFQSLGELRDKFYRVILKVTPKIPWMKYREIDVLKDIISSTKPQRVLEWGSGYGSVIFPELIDNVEWIAVEHDKQWSDKIEKSVDIEKVKLVCLPPDNPTWKSNDPDGTEEDFKKYIREPLTYGYFDLIIIDGRARTYCLREAQNILNEEGIVFLHDANRKEYLKFAKDFANSILLGDYRNDAGGIWLGAKHRFEKKIDLAKHKRIFSIANQSKLMKIMNL